MNSNMYTDVLDSAWNLFGEFLHGQYDALLVAVSSVPLNEQATEALQSTFSQLEYGSAACTFVVVKAGPDSVILSPSELFLLLESLDPLLVVVTDKAAADAFSQAYKEPVLLEKRHRIFGREIRAFASFETMLESPRGKQRAWTQLKTLPGLER